VTGAASFSVAGASTQQITSLSIIPAHNSPMPLTPPASPTVFYVVIAPTQPAACAERDSAVSWTSSKRRLLLSITRRSDAGRQGSTTITAQYTNAATAGTPSTW